MSKSGFKNIVLLSDGTGNSAKAVFKTNVWRLFQLLDLRDPSRQIATRLRALVVKLQILGGVPLRHRLRPR